MSVGQLGGVQFDVVVRCLSGEWEILVTCAHQKSHHGQAWSYVFVLAEAARRIRGTVVVSKFISAVT